MGRRGILATFAFGLVIAVPAAVGQWGNYKYFAADTYDVDENYLTGYLTWNQGLGGIAWDPAAPSEDNGGNENVANGANSALGWPLRRNGISGSTVVPVDTFTSEPLPKTIFLNTTRPIHVDVYSLQCPSFIVELYADTKLIAGSMWTHAGPPWGIGSPGDYCGVGVRMHAETDILTAGTRLVLHLIWAERTDGSNAGVTKAEYGLAEGHRSVLRLPFFGADDVLTRVPIEKAGPGVAFLERAKPASEPISDSASSWGALAIVALPRRRAWTVAALVLVAAFAGCAGSPPSATGDLRSDLNEGGRGTVEATIVPESESANGSRGSLFGVVHDDLAIPLGNVHVSLLGSNNFTRTDSQGRFVMRDIVPGTYVARFDRVDFASYETPIEIRGGSLTRIEVTLASTLDPDFRPHRHDYWGERVSIPYLEQAVTFTDSRGDRQACMNSAALNQYADFGDGFLFSDGYHCRQFVRLPEPDGTTDVLILPGTYDVEVTVTWDPVENQVDWVGVGYQSNAAPPSLEAQTGNETLMYPRTSGTSTHIRTSWEMTDIGHQQFSTWRLFLYVPTLGKKPNFMSGAFDVKVTLHKGVVPLEPGHRDFWGDKTVLPVLESEAVKVICTAQCSFPNNALWTPVRLVPPETAQLKLVLIQDKMTVPDPLDWGLLYRPANVPPQSPPDYSKFKRVEGGTADATGLRKEYTLILEPEEADAFYARRSNWAFALDDGRAGSVSFTNGPITFELSISAVRDVSTTQTKTLLGLL